MYNFPGEPVDLVLQVRSGPERHVPHPLQAVVEGRVSGRLVAAWVGGLQPGQCSFSAGIQAVRGVRRQQRYLPRQLEIFQLR